MKKISDNKYISSLNKPNRLNSMARWKSIKSQDEIKKILKGDVEEYRTSACYSGINGGEEAIFTYSIKKHMVDVDICRDYIRIISSMTGIFRSKVIETENIIGILYRFPKSRISRSSMLLALTLFRPSNENLYQRIAIVMSYLMSRNKIVSDKGEVDIDHSNPWNLLLISSMFSIGSGHNLRRPLSVPRFLESYESFKYDFGKMKRDKRNIHTFCSLTGDIVTTEKIKEVGKKHGKNVGGRIDETSMLLGNVPSSDNYSVEKLNNTLHYIIDLQDAISKDKTIKS